MMLVLSRMISRLMLFGVIALCSLTVHGTQKEINPPSFPADDTVTAIVGGTLIDGRGGTPIANSVVLVRGAKILAVGAAGNVAVPKEARQVDASGQSVLPGLIDSHFHSRFDVITPITYELHRGITSFRDPGHPFRFYDSVRRSERPMPRVFLCGAHLDGPPPVWPDQAIVIRDAAHARQTVMSHAAGGASAIKVYFRLPLEHVRAACETARDEGLLVTAHLELVDADEAIRAGVRGIEHVTAFGTALATLENQQRFKDAVQADSNARKEMRHRLWSTLDLERNERLRPLIELLLEKEVFVSPTLAIFERRAGVKDGTAEQEKAFANMLAFVRACHQAGVKIVVGSHTRAPFAESGRAYQREIELLIECGMSPLEVIRAGTVWNAQFFGVEDRLGTIEPGKLADLLVVDGDPSKRIGDLSKVRRVMLNGSWIDLLEP